MNARLPGPVKLIRRSIVHGEYLDALATLAAPYPCDGCALFDLCKAKRLACRRFVAYVHNGHGGGYSNRKPTAGQYDEAMAADPPAWLTGHRLARSEKDRASLEAWRREFVGRTFEGRQCVGVVRNHRGSYCARMHCAECGVTSSVDICVLQKGRTPMCRCAMFARKRERERERFRAEFTGKELANGWQCVAVEYVARRFHGKPNGSRTYLRLQHTSGAIAVRTPEAIRKGQGMRPPGEAKRQRRAYARQKFICDQAAQQARAEHKAAREARTAARREAKRAARAQARAELAAARAAARAKERAKAERVSRAQRAVAREAKRAARAQAREVARAQRAVDQEAKRAAKHAASARRRVERAAAKDAEWIGREVGGRVVVARMGQTLRMHCPKCGRDGTIRTCDARNGRIRKCLCTGRAESVKPCAH